MSKSKRRNENKAEARAPPGGAPAATVNGCDVPSGWTPDGWAWNLRRVAGLCRDLHPERARQLEEWAEKLTDLATRHGSPAYGGPWLRTLKERTDGS